MLPRAARFSSPPVHLLRRGHLGLPPGVGVGPQLEIVALAAAEHEIAHVLDLVDLAAHQVDEVSLDDLRPPAVPFGDGVFGEEVEIFMPPVEEKQGIGKASQLLQALFFLFASVPEEPEIAADDEGIPLADLPPGGRGEAGGVPVQGRR